MHQFNRYKFLFFLIFFGAYPILVAQDAVDSLNKNISELQVVKVNSESDQRELLNLYEKKYLHFRAEGQLDSAINALGQMIACTKALEDKEKAIECYINWAGIEKERYEIEEAINIYNTAIEELDLRNDSTNYSCILTHIAITYSHNYQNTKAYEAILLAYKFLPPSSFYSGCVAKTHFYMADLHFYFGDSLNGETYLEEAKKVMLANNDYYYLYYLSTLEFVMYDNRGMHDQSLLIADEIIKFADSTQDVFKQFSALCYKVGAIIKLKELEKAGTIIEQLDSFRNLPFSSLLPYYHIKLNYYEATDNVAQRLAVAKELYEEALINKHFERIAFSSEIISAIYEEFNQTDSALLYYKVFKQYSDTIYNNINSQQAAAERLKYEYEKEKALLNSENASKLKQKNLQLQFTIILILIALLALTIVVVNYRRNLKQKEFIQQQQLKLDGLLRLKDKLFANISHEFQTPITLLLGNIKQLLKLELSEAIEKKVHSIHKSATYLKSSTKQLLDLSKLEQDRLPLNISKFKLIDLIHYIKEEYSSLADYQNINFTITSIFDEGLNLETDGEKLLTVIKNVLSNAFKFTNFGGAIDLTIVENENGLEISIKDTGIGIRRDELDLIFNRYFQTNDTSKNIHSGIGIGLAMSKEYVEQLEGSIEVASNEGQGSIFTIKIPKIISIKQNHSTVSLSFENYSDPEPIVKEERSRINLKETQNLPEVLIVEDNVEMGNYLQELLVDELHVQLTPNGKTAMEYLNRSVPALIITDLMMPMLNGFELVNHLKSHENLNDIPLIMLTAKNGPDTKINALRMGVDVFLNKPFLEEELFASIHLLLENSYERKTYKELQHQEDKKVRTEFSQEDIEWLEKMDEVIHKNISNPDFDVSDLAGIMAVSYPHIFNEVKRLTGFTPLNYIKEIRLIKSKEMLDKNLYRNIKSVAYQVGIINTKTFSKNFKKRFGKTPSEYIKE